MKALRRLVKTPQLGDLDEGLQVEKLYTMQHRRFLH